MNDRVVTMVDAIPNDNLIVYRKSVAAPTS